MKILNLVYPEKSDIKYKISKFPDGQQQVKIIDFGLSKEDAAFIGGTFLGTKKYMAPVKFKYYLFFNKELIN